MTYLFVAALVGGAAGVWVAWPHGALACIVAAPVAASVCALITAAGARWRPWRLASRPAPVAEPLNAPTGLEGPKKAS